MFNNAQMVEIGGKEVKSIVLQDGGVLYEKENDIPKIRLSADKNILSYADSESCTLTANVIGIEEEKTVHTYTDNNYHQTPSSYALQLNSNSHVQASINQAEFHINGKTGTIYIRSMWGTFNIGEFNVEKPIFFDLNNSGLYYYDQNDQLVINNDGLYTTAWILLEGDSFDIIEYPLITFKSNILKSNIVNSNNSYSCSSDDILLDINLNNMGSNITIQIQDNSTIEISKNNTTFTITYDQQSFNTNNSNLILIRKFGTFGIKKDNGEYLWCGYSGISGISINSGFIVIDEYYYKEAMFNPNTETNVTYNSQGAGDVTITAECMNLQKTFGFEDCKYFNDGSSIGSLSIGSGITCTSNGNYITIATNTSGEKYVNLPVNIMDGDEFSFELAEFGVTNDMAWQVYNGRAWGATTTNSCVINLEDSASSYYDISAHIGQRLSIQYQNGVCSVYFDGDLKKSKSVYLNNSNVGFYTNNGRRQCIKNIKLKPL